MNSNVKFMLNLRFFILALYNNQDVSNALELKEFLLDNCHHLPDGDATVAFIDALFMLCEFFHADCIDSFYMTSCNFYGYMMDIKTKDVFFIGKESAYKDFTTRVNIINFNIHFYNSEKFIDIEKLSKEIYNSPFSVLAYDYHGSNAVLNKGVCRPFSHYLYEAPQKITRELHEDWTLFFAYQYMRLLDKKFKQIIFGSSYAYHALTDVNSENSVSFSIPGLDIISAMQLYHEIHKVPLDNKVIFCFGLYDFFKEIKKGNAKVYVDAYKAVTSFMNGKDLSPESQSGRLHNHTTNLNISTSVDVLVSSRYLDDGTAENNRFENKNDDNDVILEMQKKINSAVQISKEEGEKLGIHTVSVHNKYIKYEDSFELNCRLMEELKNNANHLEKEVYFIIPPVQRSYIENLDKHIKHKVYNFLSTLKSQHFHVYDYSTDRDFHYCDFLDGHHLNMFGAKKLRNKLCNAGILDNEIL